MLGVGQIEVDNANPTQNCNQYYCYSCCHCDCEKVSIRCRLDRRHAADWSLVLVWVYLENKGNAEVMQAFAKGALWSIVPIILFFLVALLTLLQETNISAGCSGFEFRDLASRCDRPPMKLVYQVISSSSFL